MDDPRWLRLIMIGLILAALALGYFLLSGKFAQTVNKTAQNSPTASVLGQASQVQGQENQIASPNPTAKLNGTPAPTSAYAKIAARTQNQTTTLPKTGFPQELAIIFSVSAMISGWGLRKFPK